MQPIVVTLTLVAACVPAFAAQTPDREMAEVVGPVKSVFVEDACVAGGVAGPRTPSSYEEFDASGRLVERRYYSGDMLFVREVSTYASDGSRRTRQYQNPEVGGIPGAPVGPASKETPARPHVAPDGARLFLTTFKTGEGGRTTESATYYGETADPKALSGRKSYRYDRHGRLTERTDLDAEGKQTFRVELEYDADGRLASTRRSYGKGSKASETTYVYKRESGGNWIEREVYTADGTEGRPQLESVEYRTIEIFAEGPPARPRGQAEHRGTPRTDRNSRVAHAELVRKARTGRIDLYFVGDSITRRWGASDPQYSHLLANWTRNFRGWNAGNFGWGGDRVEHILWRLNNGELDGVDPKVIVVLAGTNDVGNMSPRGDDDPRIAQIARGIEAVLEVCRRKAPNATIVLMGITPRNDNVEVMAIIERVNERVARLADGKRVRFLDINRELADADGRLFEGMADGDGLHLALRGYQVWADALKPVLTELLGPPGREDHAPRPTGDPSLRERTGARP